jgi:intein/homing endonuclease
MYLDYKILDLDNLTKEQNIVFNEVALKTREIYNKLINELSSNYFDNIHWIVGSIASRNKYQSPLFFRCIQLNFLDYIIRQNLPIQKIYTSDYQLFIVLKDQIKIDCEIYFKTNKKLYFLDLVRPIRQYLFTIFIFSQRFIFKKRFNSIKLRKKKIILVDTFVLNNKNAKEGCIIKKEYHDRYFTGLLDNLNESQKKNLYFVPTIIGFNNVYKAFKSIRNSSTNFILHDDFLRFTDYLEALKHPFKISKIKFKRIIFKDFDISNLINHEITYNSCDHISLLAILYYRFTYRLSNEKLDIHLMVEWYENQVIDRAMIRGFHDFLPNTPTIGYQGYIISKGLHIYTQPNMSEYLSHCVPNKIAVTGPALIENIKEFCRNVNVVVAPGFRFQNLWNKIIQEKNNIFTILVGLPLNLADVIHILNLLIHSENNLLSKYKFYIKPHPTTRLDEIKKYFTLDQFLKFNFVFGSFHYYLDKSNLVITNASSVALESVAKAKPVIIVAPDNGILQNPIPDSVSTICWNICYNKEELEKSINNYYINENSNYEEYLKIAQNIKLNYFEPVTEESVLKFLNLNAN